MARQGKQNIRMKSGDAKTITVIVRIINPDGSIGAVKNLLGSQTIKYQAAVSIDDTPVITKGLTTGITFVTDGSDGKFKITLDKVDTENLSGCFYQEIEVVDSAGKPSTPKIGNLYIEKTLI